MTPVDLPWARFDDHLLVLGLSFLQVLSVSVALPQTALLERKKTCGGCVACNPCCIAALLLAASVHARDWEQVWAGKRDDRGL